MNLNSFQKGLIVMISVYHGDCPYDFERAIISILNQSLTPSSIYIVVDGPISDQIKTKLQYFLKKENVQVINIEQNVGVGLARNIALKKIEYKYVAFMDSDDESYPDRLLMQAKKILSRNLEHSNFIIGGYIKEYNKIDALELIRKTPISHTEIISYSKYRNPFNHVTILINKNLFDELNGYSDIRYYEDYDLFLRAIQSPNVHLMNIPEVLVKVKTDKGMYARRGGIKNATTEIKFLLKHLRMGNLNLLQFLINVLVRIPIRLVTPNIRKFFYQFFLRSNSC